MHIDINKSNVIGGSNVCRAIHTLLANRKLHSSMNQFILDKYLNEIKISSFELVRIQVIFFFPSFIFFTVVWHLKDRWEYGDTIGEMAFARARTIVMVIGGGQTINLTISFAAQVCAFICM